MPRNAQAQILYVSQLLGDGPIGVVSEFNATTGAAITPSLITGLSHPKGLAVLGNALFVVNGSKPGDDVGKYDVETGAGNSEFIKSFNDVSYS